MANDRLLSMVRDALSAAVLRGQRPTLLPPDLPPSLLDRGEALGDEGGRGGPAVAGGAPPFPDERARCRRGLPGRGQRRRLTGAVPRGASKPVRPWAARPSVVKYTPANHSEGAGPMREKRTGGRRLAAILAADVAGYSRLTRCRLRVRRSLLRRGSAHRHRPVDRPPRSTGRIGLPQLAGDHHSRRAADARLERLG